MKMFFTSLESGVTFSFEDLSKQKQITESFSRTLQHARTYVVIDKQIHSGIIIKPSLLYPKSVQMGGKYTTRNIKDNPWIYKGLGY